MKATLKRRPIITLAVARPIIDPWTPDLRDSLHEAWGSVQRMLDEDPVRRVMFDQSTQASMFYNAFIMLLIQRVQGRPGVEVIRRGRMTQLRLGEKVRLRFKKLDNQLRSKNVKTTQQAMIYFQLSLPGLDEPLTDLTFGYTTDRTGRKLRGAWIICPKSWSRNVWTLPIFDALSDATPLLPVSPTPDMPLPAVKVKGAPEKKAVGE